MARIPQVVTHNYDPRRGAFRNLCHLPPPEAESVLAEIRATGKRAIRANYLQKRLAVEDWLMRERRKKLGATYLERPIYFFLGNFADGRDPSRPVSFVLPLAAFPPDTLTFTYPDSMASLPLATQDEHAEERRPYHGRVFELREIEAVVAAFGMPGQGWRTDPSRRYDTFIEVQVWDDRPIKPFLDRQNSMKDPT